MEPKNKNQGQRLKINGIIYKINKDCIYDPSNSTLTVSFKLKNQSDIDNLVKSDVLIKDFSDNMENSIKIIDPKQHLDSYMQQAANKMKTMEEYLDPNIFKK